MTKEFILPFIAINLLIVLAIYEEWTIFIAFNGGVLANILYRYFRR